ncbi:hypothetical protein BME99_21350 [Pseudomonas protegens]|nr:hypothetical protein BME99_21350 [Pseudomonas protegens]
MHPGFALRRVEVAKLPIIDVDPRLLDHLPRLIVLQGKDRAQALMPLQQPVEGLRQHCPVQRPAQADRVGQVVGRALRVQLPEKPHALLRIGQGLAIRHRNPRRNRQQREVDAFLVQSLQEQPALFQRQFNESAGELQGVFCIHRESSVLTCWVSSIGSVIPTERMKAGEN